MLPFMTNPLNVQSLVINSAVKTARCQKIVLEITTVFYAQIFPYPDRFSLAPSPLTRGYTCRLARRLVLANDFCEYFSMRTVFLANIFHCKWFLRMILENDFGRAFTRYCNFSRKHTVHIML
jgi:hypothetical protein